MANQSVQFSRSVVSNSLWPHESQHARPPCPSPTLRVHSNSCPLSRWCHPAILSSVVPFSSCPQCGKYYFWYSFIGFLMCFQWLQLVIHVDYCYKNHCFSCLFSCVHIIWKHRHAHEYSIYIFCIPIHVQTSENTHVHTNMYLHIHMYAWEHVHTHTYMSYKCMYTHKWKHVQSEDMCTCSCIHIHFWLPCFVPDILETITETIIYLSFNFLSIVVYVSFLKCRRLYSARNVCLYLLPSVKLRF